MIDWTDAFDNSGYVPGADDLIALWAQEAEVFRASLGARAQCDLPYGGGARERLDLFLPKGKAQGLVVFIHGGYWHRLDRSYFSQFARGPLAQGWAVAMPSYPLAPDARIPEITQSVCLAVGHAAGLQPGPIRLFGHSAGGHLAARMACEGVLPDAVAERLARVVSVSGIHMLEPLTLAEMNDTLNLTPETARAESPALLDPIKTCPFSIWVGANERPELIRQTRLLAEAWSLKDVEIASEYERGRDHFDVIASLKDPDGALTREVLR
ncbi:MAG: alpha/beta hydrolase [Pseudomonadota bacterium]